MDIFVNGAVAFQQVVLFIMALLFLAIGGLLFGHDLYWRCRALRVQGTVVGVREKSGCYMPVYRYMLPGGETFEATSDTGSSLAKGKETYSTVPLMVFPEDPLIVSPANSYAMAIIGFIILVAGLGMAYAALTLFPVTWISGGIFAAMIVYISFGFRKYIIPKDQRLSPSLWKAARKAKNQKERESVPVRPIEDILASPEAVMAREKQKKDSRIAAPVVLLFALMLMYAGYSEYYKLSSLVRDGVRVEGKITGMQARENKYGMVYYPIVTFADKQGKSFTFMDARGGNVPEYKTGESVKVMYLEDNPQKNSAIDHDFWDRIMPVILFSFGVLLFFLFLKVLE